MSDLVDILGLTSDELIQAAAGLPGGRVVAGQIYRHLFHAHEFAPELFVRSSASVAAWRARFTCGFLPVERVIDEPSDGAATAKAILGTHDKHRIECVRIPMRIGGPASEPLTSLSQHHETATPQNISTIEPISTTLCVSSQVGCRMGCTFCETGRMGLIRHLSAAEIIAQVLVTRRDLNWHCRNIVFMGMGEALDNVDNVIQALRILTDQRGLHYSQERITVCTSGHAAGIARLKALGWKRLNVSISLNATTDAQRDRIMPVNRRTPLAELQRILADYPQRRNFTLGVNYCLLPGINDTHDDALRIAEFCRPLGRTLVNLIPYNPGTDALTRPPREDEVVGFIDWLRDAGVAVRRRITKGRSIMAACGQLGDGQRRSRPVPRTPEIT